MTESEKLRLYAGLRRALRAFAGANAGKCAQNIAERAELPGHALVTMISFEIACAAPGLSEHAHSVLCRIVHRAVDSVRRGAISICLTCGGETDYLRPHVCAECHRRACVDLHRAALLQAARGAA